MSIEMLTDAELALKAIKQTIDMGFDVNFRADPMFSAPEIVVRFYSKKHNQIFQQLFVQNVMRKQTFALWIVECTVKGREAIDHTIEVLK